MGKSLQIGSRAFLLLALASLAEKIPPALPPSQLLGAAVDRLILTFSFNDLLDIRHEE